MKMKLDDYSKCPRKCFLCGRSDYVLSLDKIEKMRLNQIFLRNKQHARAPQNENKVLFKELRPLVLDNKVPGNTKDIISEKCLFEMSLLFKCWVENEFHNKNCDQYIQQLQNCYKNYTVNAKQRKEMRKLNIPVPGSTNLTNNQLTYLLQLYPTI